MDFSFLKTPELRTFIETFNTVAEAHSNDNVDTRALRIALAGTKATLDQALVEFPKNYITNVLKDIQDLVVSKEADEAVSATVRALTPFNIFEVLEEAKFKLTTPEVSLAIAGRLKQLLAHRSTDSLREMLGNLPIDPQEAEALFDSMVAPVLNQASNSSQEDIAQQLVRLTSKIPTYDLAVSAGHFTKTITPEVVHAAAVDAIDKIPAASEIADVIHDLGHAASAALGEALKGTTREQILSPLAAFIENASSIVEKALEEGNAKRAEKDAYKKLGFKGFPGEKGVNWDFDW